MKILILAPHPYYQERGTPIAVDLLVRALCERGDTVDLLTYHEGSDRQHKRFQIYRINPFPKVGNLCPGFSLKKIYCDVFMFFKFILMIWKNKYDVVHAVEESAFMALLICPLRSVPYVYDMDSLMSTQLVDRSKFLRPFRSILRFLESLPMRFAEAVVPVCEALADEVRRYRDNNIVILKDISLVDDSQPDSVAQDLRHESGATGKIVMYVGNLESYQGIDLLLESFFLVRQQGSDVSLMVIGGTSESIAHYKDMAENLGISQYVYFMGPRPVKQIGQFMMQADVLVSPRTQGENTPMKIYSYLDSGVAVMATRLPTHTQVMSDDIAMLAEPNKEDFSLTMLKLLASDSLRERLACSAKEYISREHSYPVFRKRVFDLYDRLEKVTR